MQGTLMATIVLSQMPLYTFPKEPLPTKGPKRTSWKGVRSFVLEGSILHPHHNKTLSHVSRDYVLSLGFQMSTLKHASLPKLTCYLVDAGMTM